MRKILIQRMLTILRTTALYCSRLQPSDALVDHGAIRQDSTVPKSNGWKRLDMASDGSQRMRVRIRDFAVVAIMNNQRVTARFTQHFNNGEAVKAHPIGVARFEIVTNSLGHLIRQAEVMLGSIDEPAAVLERSDSHEIWRRQAVLTRSQQRGHDAK